MNFSRRTKPRENDPPTAAAARNTRFELLGSDANFNARRKLGYPANNSSPPSPDNATVTPAFFTARETTNVLTPSIDG